jgi:hypothetical protein
MMSTVTLPPTTPHQLAWMLAAPALLAWPALPSGAAASPIFQSQHLLRAEIDGGRRRSPRLAPWRELEGSPHRRSARPKDSRARAPREHEGGRVDRAVLRGLGAAPRAGLVGAVLRAVPAREPPVSRQDRTQPADASTDPADCRATLSDKVVLPPADKPIAPDQVVIRREPPPGVFNPDSGVGKKNQDLDLAGYDVIADIVNEATGLVRHRTVDFLPALSSCRCRACSSRKACSWREPCSGGR